MNNGYQKLYRKFLDWEWFHISEMVQIFIFLLLSANHKDKKWRGILVKRGQLITSLDSISEATHLSIGKIRTCLERLKSTSEITNLSTNRYRIITICNYESYQSTDIEPDKQVDKQIDKQATSKQQASNNKQERKELKKEKNNTEKNNTEKKDSFFIADTSLLEEYPILQDEAFKAKYQEWAEHRAESKKPLTKTTVTAQLKMLSDYSADVAVKMIQQSILNQWQGLFPLKESADTEKVSLETAAKLALLDDIEDWGG